MYTVCS